MSVGAELAAARAAARLTVEDVARITRVRAGLLRQIEADDFSGCGGDVYARGHIKSMAAAIGVDAAPFLTAFQHQQGTAPTAAVAIESFAPTPVAGRALRPRTGPNWTLYAVVAAGVVTVLLGVNLVQGSGKHPAQTIAQTGGAPVVPAVTPSQAASSAAPPAATNLTADAGVDVVMTIATQPSWVSVTDGVSRTKLFEGILAAGSSRDFHADTKIVFTLGNAGAVDLTVNGHDIGAPGSLGQVVNQTYGPGDPATQTQG